MIKKLMQSTVAAIMLYLAVLCGACYGLYSIGYWVVNVLVALGAFVAFLVFLLQLVRFLIKRSPDKKTKAIEQGLVFLSFVCIFYFGKLGWQHRLMGYRTVLEPVVEYLNQYKEQQGVYPQMLSDLKSGDQYPKNILFLGEGNNAAITDDVKYSQRNIPGTSTFFLYSTNDDHSDFRLTVILGFDKYSYDSKTKKWYGWD